VRLGGDAIDLPIEHVAITEDGREYGVDIGGVRRWLRDCDEGKTWRWPASEEKPGGQVPQRDGARWRDGEKGHSNG
jgi:hypothetical protein